MKKSKSIRQMRTTIYLTIYHLQADSVIEEIVKLLKMYENRFSANNPASELNQINRNAGICSVKVYPELYELIRIGKKHSLPLNSHLNIH